MENQNWAISGTDLHRVIVVHEGPHDNGTEYTDGRHQHTICVCDNELGNAKENAKRIAAMPEAIALLEKALTLQEPIYQSFTVSNETSLIFSGIRALLARIAAPALLLFALSLPARAQVAPATPGFELEYMLSITDELGQIRFDTIDGSGTVQITELLQNGAELPDTVTAKQYDIFLYKKGTSKYAQTTFPEVSELEIHSEGYYRLEVVDRDNQIDRVSQFWFQIGPWETWRIIYIATVR